MTISSQNLCFAKRYIKCFVDKQKKLDKYFQTNNVPRLHFLPVRFIFRKKNKHRFATHCRK